MNNKIELKLNHEYIVSQRINPDEVFKMKVLEITNISVFVQDMDSLKNYKNRILLNTFYDKFIIYEELPFNKI